MKPTFKRNAPIPHAHWKLKWGSRQPSGSTRSKRSCNAYDTQEFCTASLPDAITF